MNIDKLFKDVIGDFGRQQQLYCLVLSSINCYFAFQMLQYKFAAPEPTSFRCLTKPANESASTDGDELLNKCPDNQADNCLGGIEYPAGKEAASVASEWDLVCDRGWMAPFTMSVLMAGVMLGAVVLGPLADRFGRQKTLLANFTAMMACNGLAAFAPTFKTYCLLRFLCGFFESGALLSCFVLMNELIGASKRGLVGVATQGFFAVGIALLSGLAMVTEGDWRRFTHAITFLGLPFVPLVAVFLPESPRWLLSHGRHSEATQVLKHIAYKNGAKWRDVGHASQDTPPTSEKTTTTANQNTDSLAHLLTRKEVASLTLIQVYSWFANSGTYYGLTLAAGGESGSAAPHSAVYLSTALSGLVEIPAYVLAVILLPILGRRKTLVAFMVAGGVACTAIAVVSGMGGLRGGLALLGKLCISASFAVIYVHSNEIFPTSIRNGGMGLVSFAARIGGILSPYLAKLGSLWPNLHFVLFGLMALTSGLMNARLPETQGKPLPETIDDLVKMSSRNSGRYVVSLSTPSKYSKLPTEEEQID